MKALSLWQPWASAIALGMKRVETRSWGTAYRGPIAIHAAKRWTLEEREIHELEVRSGAMPAEIPLGAVVAVARLVAVHATLAIAPRISAEELRWGNYAAGRFGWELEDIEPLAEPVPFRGMQGLFEIPDDLVGRSPSAPAQGALL